LEQLQQEYGDRIKIVWRAFELRPDPVPTLDPDGAYLHDIWRRAVYPMAQNRGMILRLPPVQPRSSRALEAAEFAREQRQYEAMHHALFKAFFEDGRDLNDVNVLVEVAAAVGLDGEALRQALNEGRYTSRVVEDERLAQELRVSGVPALFIGLADQLVDRSIALSGAQPYEQVRQVVEQVSAQARQSRQQQQ
jgi:predicted DsbA family dithiol-disulfide isomerase